jgi:hypothetical protein
LVMVRVPTTGKRSTILVCVNKFNRKLSYTIPYRKISS